MKCYRIKHVPTGLYYKPSKHRSKSNLSKKGKIYYSKPSTRWCNSYHHPDDVKINSYSPKIRKATVDEFIVEEYVMTYP